MKITIYWITKDRDKIKWFRERFKLGDYLSINGETPANIPEEDMPLLRKAETRGFLQIRIKP